MFSENGRPGSNVADFPRYENNKLFTRFLNVDLSLNKDCFIPTVGFINTLKNIYKLVDSEMPLPNIKVSYPLCVGGVETRKTADSIIQSINNCSSMLRLRNIKTSKGLDYYGGQGIIFDENWNPMMLCGFIINIDTTNKCVNIVNPICYISPDVFDSNDILSKAIIKKIIPYLGSESISMQSTLRESYFVNCDNYYDNIPIRIERIDKFFTCPCSPGNAETLNCQIWEFLERNKESLS